MAESFQGLGGGILKGLKKVLFSSSPEESTIKSSPKNPHDISGNEQSKPSPKVAINAVEVSPFSDSQLPENTLDLKEMKLRVYQLLEQMNKPGVDFFEVWNASVEMGGANVANLKSAFTSLRFADKALNKTRLIESGEGYVKELQTVFETESKKRKEEKARIEAEKEQVRAGLTSDINTLQLQIKELQAKMDNQKQKLLSIDENYNPRLISIEQKINGGSIAVKSVLDEMQQVIQIIKNEIN